MGGVTDATLIQKALWLCRGFSGKCPHLPQPHLMGGVGKEVSDLCPSTPAKQINNQQRNNPPLSPCSLRYAQLLGLEAPHLGRGEKDGEGSAGKRQNV